MYVNIGKDYDDLMIINVQHPVKFNLETLQFATLKGTVREIVSNLTSALYRYSRMLNITYVYYDIIFCIMHRYYN
jgi:hypothetical protein